MGKRAQLSQITSFCGMDDFPSLLSRWTAAASPVNAETFFERAHLLDRLLIDGKCMTLTSGVCHEYQGGGNLVVLGRNQ